MPGTSSISLSPSGSHICLCPTTTARVPRPRNAFILYRQHHHSAVVAEYPGKSNPEISKIIGEQWRSLPQAEKEFWIQQGDVEKKSHLERFPDYRYQPRRSSKKGGASGSNNNSTSDNNNSTGICPNCKGITSASNSTSFVNSYKNQQQQQQNQQQRSQPQPQQQPPQHLPPAPSNQIPPPPPPPQQQLQPHQILSQPSSLTSSPSLSQAHPQQPPYYPPHLSHPLPNSPSFQPNHFPPPAPLQPLNYEGPTYPHPYPLHKGSAPANPHYGSYERHSPLNQHLFNASVRHQSAPEISKSYPYKQPPTGPNSSKPSISTSLGSISSISSISSSTSSSISSSSSSISSVSSLPPLPRIIPREELINGQQPLTPKMSPDLRNTSWSSTSTITSRAGSTDSPLRPFTFYDKPPPPPPLPASTINISGNLNSTSKPKEDVNNNNKNSTLPLKINTSGPFAHPQGFSTPSTTIPHHPPPFPQTKFKSSLYTTLTTLSEEEDRYKKRRTSSYHDPLINTPVNPHTPSLLSRGERYQSAIALASTNKFNSITERHNLSVRDKAEILSTTCDVTNYKDNSRLIIAIEGPDTEMVQKVSKLLAEKVGKRNGCALSIDDEIKSRLANSGFKNEKANSIFKIACVHELLADIDLTQLHYLFLGGYLIHLTDSLAGENKSEIKREHQDETGEEFKKYSERWYSGASMLRGLPGPNFIVYLQPQEATRVSQQHGEITMVELKGGSRMLIIGGGQHERKEQDITENIMKAANIKLDEKDL